MFETVSTFFQTMHWGAVFQIIMIDILLGGDNAVIIALACRNLPKEQRFKGIMWGTAGAIVLRVLLIIFAVQMLAIPLLKFVAGLLLFWIGVKLLLPQHDEHGEVKAGTTVMEAIKTIIIADFVMSLDNVIAIAGAAQNADPSHQTGLIIFGLLVSVPIIVWGSTLVLKLIDRFPIVITLGGGLLGWIAGGMLVTDIFIIKHVNSVYLHQFTEPQIKLVAEIVGALFVIGLGSLLARYKRNATKG